MAKTKWIVPAVALALCAVSLIGAAYAAYSATLRDTETQNLTSNYIELTMGDYHLGGTVNVYWTYDATATAGIIGTKTYTPYLDAACTKNVAQTAELGSFKILKTKVGNEIDSNTFALAFTAGPTFTTGNLTGATLSVVNENGSTVADENALSYDTVYKIVLSYTQDGTKDIASAAPLATMTFTYDLTATANIA